MREADFVRIYSEHAPCDPVSQAVAQERALARFAGWRAVIDKLAAGQAIDKGLLNNAQEGAFTNSHSMVEVRSITRDANGDALGARTFNVSAKQLAEERLRGMCDAFVAVLDAQTKAGVRIASGF